MKRYKIIIVEDDPDEQEIINDAFQKVGFKGSILCFDSGKYAIAHLDHLDSSTYPLLIILDYNMPGLNGKETLELLKANPFTAKIPVVIYSTSFLPGVRKEIEKHGALMCITKGDSETEIVEQARFFKELI